MTIIEYGGLTAVVYSGGPLGRVLVQPERQFFARVSECSAPDCTYYSREKYAAAKEEAVVAATAAWHEHVKVKHRGLLLAWQDTVATQEATAAAVGGVVAPPRFERMISDAVKAMERAKASRAPFELSPTEAAALHRLLDAYLATEEHDPGLDALRAVFGRIDGIPQDHSVYIAAYGDPGQVEESR